MTIGSIIISEQIHYKLNEVEIIIFKDPLAAHSFPSSILIPARAALQQSDEALNGEWI